jgi:leader peptidase (prepilin peptidase)/N-methyltransferase
MIIALVLLVGLLIGSFLNVCIVRLPLGQSIVTPPSQCPRCKQPIKFYDNIPVISYLLLRGKCRTCGLPISWRYPMV